MLLHRTSRSAHALAALFAVWLMLCASAALAADPDEIHWTILGQSAVTLNWRGTSNAVNFGITSGYGSLATGVTPVPVPLSSAGPFWEARITGLAENTLYHYSIGGGPDHTFRTPPPRGASDFVVAVEGDIGSTLTPGFWRVASIQNSIATSAPRFALMVGDLTYANDQGPAATDRHFNDMMAWSRDAAYMPIWGNHDGARPDTMDDYKGRFDLPNSKTSPNAFSPGGEDWYWFDYGNVRFIAYPEPYSGAWADWNLKAAALMDSAQADTSLRFIVTFGHRPAYSTGHHAGSPSLKSYLDALGAAHSKYVLNLNGHSHDYERSMPQSGVIHITAGGGGATLEAESGPCLWVGGCPPPSWSAFRAMHHSWLRLSFTPDGIEGEAICGPAGDANNPNDVTCLEGSVMDAFTIANPPDSPPAVSAPGLVNATVTTPLTVPVNVTDANGDAIASLTADLSGLPPGHGAVFTEAADHRSGTLAWTPGPGHAGGPYTVTFTATNALSGHANTAFLVGTLGANQVGNPSFETATTGWSAYHGAAIARVGGGHDSGWTLRVSGPDSLTADFGVNDGPNWVAVATPAGTRYRFSAWVRSGGSLGSTRFQIREYKNLVQQGPTKLSTLTALSPTWTQLIYEYATLVDSSTLDLQVLEKPVAASESFDLDDIAIQKVPATTDVPRVARPAASFVARFTPNPTRAGGRLKFALARGGFVRGEILDLSGRRRRTVIDRALEPGAHAFQFDGHDERGTALEPGVYFFVVRAGEGVATGRFLVAR